MTERIYYRDMTTLAFDATAIAHDGSPLRVVLDRTAFYPTSGGQPHDVGTLGTARVIDVLDDDDRIVHVLDAPLPLGPVRGDVDAARRHDYTVQHTAQHLLSALAGDRLGWSTESVHFGADHATIEFGVADARDAQLADLERWTLDAIAEARPVTVGFEEATDAIARGLRKPPARDGEIRIVTIEGLDRSACGGTHLPTTGRISALHLLGLEKVRGHVRLSWLAGERALRHVRGGDALVRVLANALSCSVEELGDLVPKRQQELLAARERIETLERELAGLRLRALVDATAPGVDGVRRVVHRAEADSPALLRAMAQGAGALERVLFVATGGPPPSVMVGASADSGVDAGAALKVALGAVGGRGGGSPRFAQGTAPDAGRLREVVEAVLGAER